MPSTQFQSPGPRLGAPPAGGWKLSRWDAARMLAAAAVSSLVTSLYYRESCLHSHAQLHIRNLPGEDPKHPRPLPASEAELDSRHPLSGAVFRHKGLSARAQALEEHLRALPVFVIGLDEPETHWNVKRLAYVLAQHQLTNVQWWNATDARHGLFNNDGKHWRLSGRSLSPGELGIRDSFRRLLLHAWHSGIERFIVLEDDATPHCDLANRLVEYLADTQCGGWGAPLDPSAGDPGAFLLGATCYAIGDPKLAPGWEGPQPDSCYTATMATYGAFAVMFRRDSIPAILHWLATHYVPLDNMWGQLTGHKPFHVAVAYPNLFAPELLHNSSTQPWKTFDREAVEKRYKQHRWNRPDYCGWAYEFHPDTDWQRPEVLNPGLPKTAKVLSRGAQGQPGLPPKARDHSEALMLRLMSSLKQKLETDLDPLGGLPTVIISLEPRSRRVEKLTQLLKMHGLSNVGVWHGTDGRAIFRAAQEQGLDVMWGQMGTSDLRPGEMGVIQSHRDLLRGAWFAGLDRLLVLEDDALPHCHLGEQLRGALAEELCGYLALGDQGNATHPPGVLLLGATENSKWPGLLDEVAGAQDGHPRACYTCNQGTYGAFAVVYSQRSIPYILRWMEEVPRPYDNMWHFLRTKEINVRVMFPNLFMPDIAHASLTNPSKQYDDAEVTRRLELHKWDPSLYCGGNSTKPLDLARRFGS